MADVPVSAIHNMIRSYIQKKDPPPQCEHCQCILSVYSDGAPHFAIISLRQELIYLVDVVWWNFFISTLN